MTEKNLVYRKRNNNDHKWIYNKCVHVIGHSTTNEINSIESLCKISDNFDIDAAILNKKKSIIEVKHHCRSTNETLLTIRLLIIEAWKFLKGRKNHE